MDKKKKIVFFFQILQIFITKSAYISKSWFFKKTLSFVYNFCTTWMDRNHISKFLFLTLSFIFGLEIRPEKRCSLRHCFYTRLYSFPILCKNFQKVSDIVDVSAKLKKRIYFWWGYSVYNFIDFSHEDFQIVLINCRFIFSL